MQNNGLVEVKVWRIIPSEKWRVIRLLTKISDFPAYIPSIKEASIIHKVHNTIRTRWKIQLDNITINWIDEETLVLKENRIYFRALEGDLQDFSGEWRFEDHPDGTRISVDITFKVGIPAIKEFAQGYLKKLVTRNFEAILEGLEHRLISLRYSSYKKGNTDKLAGVGLVGHPYNLKHLETCFSMLNPQFTMPSPEFISQLFHTSPSFKLYDFADFRSAAGQTINGCYIMATFMPDMLEKDSWAVLSKVVRACKIAEKHGMGIVCLFGFSSIILQRIEHDFSQELDIPVTTGNTFTAAMIIDGVLKAAAAQNKDLHNLKMTIVGGAGDIGSACSRVFAEKVKHLTITGVKKTNLTRVQAELKKKHKAAIAISTDNRAAVKDADIVIAVASATASFLDLAWFKSGAIVCDAGYPRNVHHEEKKTREDIFIFAGGLARTPSPFCFPVDLGLPSQNTVYGAFAEGIILDLEKRYESFSSGRGNIVPEKIEEIRALGAKHGFTASDFYWENKQIETHS
jgi:predicted amino acid dehydrogenase/ribosome-associated toxin RatA of RatAB toxin-antitoxin module